MSAWCSPSRSATNVELCLPLPTHTAAYHICTKRLPISSMHVFRLVQPAWGAQNDQKTASLFSWGRYWNTEEHDPKHNLYGELLLCYNITHTLITTDTWFRRPCAEHLAPMSLCPTNELYTNSHFDTCTSAAFSTKISHWIFYVSDRIRQ